MPPDSPKSPNPPGPSRPPKTIEQVVEELGLYPREAFDFVSRGLNYTVEKIHGPVSEAELKAARQRREREKTRPKEPGGEAEGGAEPHVSRHVSGRQLCEGLREFALSQWGLLARTVLRRWNITRTDDFGRIVFALVDNGIWMKTDEDRPDEFKDVFDFATGFDSGYHIENSQTPYSHP